MYGFRTPQPFCSSLQLEFGQRGIFTKPEFGNVVTVENRFCSVLFTVTIAKEGRMGRVAETVRLVRGMRDQLPPDQRALDHVVAAAVAVSERALYARVDSPVVEHTHLFE